MGEWVALAWHTAFVLATLAIPAAAEAQGAIGIVAWAEGAATEEDVAGAIAGAVAIARERSPGAAPVRLDDAASVAASCAGAECLAGLGALAGAARVLAIAVRREAGAHVAVVRLVLVDVAASRETGRVSVDGGASDWGAGGGAA